MRNSRACNPSVSVISAFALFLVAFGVLAKPTQGQVSDGNLCKDTGHPIYVNLCFSYVLKYKFDSLAGEPTKNFSLRWHLNSVRTRNPATGEGNTRLLQQWPKPFAESFKKLALDMTGNLNVMSSDGTDGRGGISWDSGVSTVQDKTSWSVPGSPNWAEFIKDRSTFACAETHAHSYESEATAKSMAKAGLKVTGNTVCKANFSGWEALDKATASYCGTAKRDGNGHDGLGLCEAQKNEKKRPEERKPDSDADFFESAASAKKNVTPSRMPDILDELTEKEFISKETEKQRSIFQRQAAFACSNAIQAVRSCRSANQCKSATQILAEAETCQKAACGPAPQEKLHESYSCGYYGDDENKEKHIEAPRPGESRKAKIVFPRFCSRDAGPNPKYAEWKQCAEQQNQCKPQPDTCEIRCNPEGYVSESHCVAQKMAGAPDTSTVGKEVRDRWKKPSSGKPQAKDFFE